MSLRRVLPLFVLLALAAFPAARALAATDEETIKVFRDAGESGQFFDKCYGYAVFANVGKGGIGVGAAHGTGRVYEKGKVVGDVKMNQVSVGAQLGGQSYSEIIFFEDKRAFDEFTSGSFEFGAEVSAVAITAGAGAKAGSSGSSAGASGGKHDAATAGGYHKGIAVFTVAKGGLMYQATVSGQKFKYTPRKK
ncbi:MAG TPA: lipid-binding SYLF domain-containing protein [Thermoanaerobaculia bacterium]|nr:lipid-binding SYLF domain-containing protein [Thermoanaerobaculia bacterium]